jgi:hypothetical protein
VKRVKPRIVAAVGYAGKGDKPRRRRTTAEGEYARVRGSKAMALMLTGAKIHRRPDKGGHRLDTNRQRNVEMAREFRKRLHEAQRRGSLASATALKQAVGKDFGLRRRAAITAVDAGLKILCGLEAKPHD